MASKSNSDGRIVLNHEKGISWCQLIIKYSNVNQNPKIKALFK
jgi:hypothetical protein